MPLDLALFLGTIAAFLLIGLPLIRANVFLPERLEFQEVPEASLTPAQRDFFLRHDALLAPLGYRALANIRVLNLQGPNLSRLYRDQSGPGLCMVSALTSADGGISTNYAEFLQVFQDGGRLTTRNNQVSDLLKPEPGHVVRDFPAVTDLAELKRMHELKVQEIGKMSRVPGRKDEILSRANEFHLSFCKHQASLGLLRLEASSGRYRATTKLGLLGIAGYLNPFSDGFTWPRLGLALAAGIILPLAASHCEPAGTRRLAEAAGLSPFWAAGLFMASAFALGGFFLGLVVQAKSFLWAFLLGWTASRLAPHAGFGHAFLSLGMGVAAELGSRVRHRLARVA